MEALKPTLYIERDEDGQHALIDDDAALPIIQAAIRAQALEDAAVLLENNSPVWTSDKSTIRMCPRRPQFEMDNVDEGDKCIIDAIRNLKGK